MKQRKSGGGQSWSRLVLLIVMGLGAILADFGQATAQSGGQSGPAGTDPTMGVLRITSRDVDSDVILKGGCYGAFNDSGGGFGCDGFDELDGVTEFEAPPGTYTAYTANPPSHHFYGNFREGIEIVAGETTSLTIRHLAGGSDIIVKSYGPTGALVPGACFVVHVNDNGVPGSSKSGFICDSYDNSLDGVARLNGISHLPEPSALVVMALTPPGYRTPAPEVLTISQGVDSRIYFHPRLATFSPSCTIGPTSGRVGATIKVNCKGFPNFQAVTVKWDGRSSASVSSFTNGDGRFTAFLTVPAATAGAHRVVVVSDTHRAPSKTFTVISSLSVSPDSGVGGSTARATMRGFSRGETVTIRVQGRRTVLATVVTSATGSGSVLFTIPDGVLADLVIRADGSAGNSALDGFGRTGPSAASDEVRSEPTETAEPTLEPTDEPEGSSSPPASPETTSTATETPPSDAPTETAPADASASPTSPPEATPSPTESSLDELSGTPSASD